MRLWRRLLMGAGFLFSMLVADAVPATPRYSAVPMIDLSGETQRQVTVDREPGHYLGHPTTVLLEDGRTMLAAYPKGHGRGAIVLKRSTDGGLTWSERLSVPENWASSLETPTVHRVVDAQGVRRLILFSGLYPIRMAVSEDDGTTWTPLSPIGDFGGVVTMSSLVALKNGHYAAYFHDDGRFLHGEGKTTGFVVYKTVSKDGGLTWGSPEEVLRHAEAHLCEPGIVRSPDGAQLAMLMRENSRKFNSFVSFSNDEGATWSVPRELPGSLTGDRHVGRYAPDGRLVFVFRDTALVTQTYGDFVAWAGTYEDLVYGRGGEYRVRLLDNTKGADCGYPGLELLPDGTFVATTYGHWAKGEEPYVMSVRFRLDELDAKGAASIPEETAVFERREAGYHTFRIPAVLAVPSGALLAFCEGRKNNSADHGDIDLVMKRSDDGGRTWGPLRLIYEEGGTADITIGNPCPVLDEDTGVVWLPFCRDNDRVFVVSSADEGQSWSEPVEITAAVKPAGWTWYATGPGVGIQLRQGPHRGRLVIPCDHRETRDGATVMVSHCFYSDDHGATWRAGGSVAKHTDECQVVELNDGRLLVNMRNYWGRDGEEPERHGMRAIALSGDGGETWMDLSFEHTLVEPVCQASFLRYSDALRHGKDRLVFSNPADSKDRVRMTVRMSLDEGATWPVARCICEGPSAYSCLTVLPDQTLGCLYERGDEHPYESIVFARITLTWLTRGGP